MTTHSSVLAFKIPGTGEPGGLLSMGSYRIWHDWSDLAAAAARSKEYLPQLNTFKGIVVVYLLKSCLTQHTRLPCPSLSPGICSNACPLSQWCHPTISFSITPFSSCPQTFPASGSFPMSQLFALGVAGKKLGILLRHEICWLSMIMTVFEGLKKRTLCDWKYISLH